MYFPDDEPGRGQWWSGKVVLDQRSFLEPEEAAAQLASPWACDVHWERFLIHWDEPPVRAAPLYPEYGCASMQRTALLPSGSSAVIAQGQLQLELKPPCEAPAALPGSGPASPASIGTRQTQSAMQHTLASFCSLSFPGCSDRTCLKGPKLLSDILPCTQSCSHGAPQAREGSSLRSSTGCVRRCSCPAGHGSVTPQPLGAV